MASTKPDRELNIRQMRFCHNYIRLGNAVEAARQAGYSERTVASQASRLLQNVRIKEEIAKLRKPEEEKHIATGQEVMQFFTDMMNGKIKDAFGLDATNSDRLKAANELAKRTVDIDNRVDGKADAKVEISLNWSRNNDDNNVNT